jgi:hypothetical protein
MVKQKVMRDGMGRKLYPDIEMADGTEENTTIDGVLCKPLEYVTVYRGKHDDNDICYDSAKELTDKEVARIEATGIKTKMEFLGGVGAIYTPVA